MGDYVSSNKIKENKYKILRMSLLLGNDDNRGETLNNFEDAAREIDAMNDEIYLRDLSLKFYDTKNLEDEENKLAVLVNYIGGRVQQRLSLLNDFSNVTGFDLNNLPPIQYYDKLDEYKERLQYIREYLDNTKRLEELNQEVENITEQLDKAYKNKASCEEFNLRNEDVLLNKFMKAVSSLDYFSDVTEDNVDERLNEVSLVVEDSKKSLDIFTKSFTTLMNSGISGDEEREYHSYVVNAQDVYYGNKEKEYFLRLYQYLIHKESEYDAILVKRDCISNLLFERINLRKEFGINDNDLLSTLYDILDRQYEDIKRQGENIENIDKYNELLLHKKEEINQLELDNQKVEILAILREFGIIDTYSDDSVEDNDDTSVESEKVSNSLIFDVPVDSPLKNETVSSSPIFDIPTLDEKVDNKVVENSEPVMDDLPSFDVPVEEVSKKEDDFVVSPVLEKPSVEESPVVEDVKDNEVVLVEDVSSIDLNLVKDKANKVMQRVGDMLGIKTSEEKIVSVSEEKVEEKENPMFNEEKSNDEDFWFTSETPDVLNELPDLEVSPEKSIDNGLNFPELKVDFGNEEVSS